MTMKPSRIRIAATVIAGGVWLPTKL